MKTYLLPFVLYLLTATGTALAQITPKTIEVGAATDTSKEAYIVEKSDEQVTYNVDGTGDILSTVVVTLQSQAGLQEFGLLNFPYQNNIERLEIPYVRVRKPDGQVVITAPESFRDQPAPVTQSAPLYSDLRYLQIPVKGLHPGDVLEYQVRKVQSKAIVPGQFWLSYQFNQKDVVREESLEVSLPTDKYVKVTSPNHLFAVKTENGRKVYRWSSSNKKDKEKEAREEKLVDMGAPGRAEPNDVEITTFHSWQELGAWYGELQRSRSVVTPLIQKKADELTRALKTDTEKITAIYNYVTLQYRYIGVDLGIGRYQPHSAEDVMANQYGDCKDKHTLFAALLQAEGIEAWPVLIGSSRRLDDATPSPEQFDHVITMVVTKKDGRMVYTFADTTPGVAPFGMLMPMLRNKQVLVIPKTGEAHLETTPANPPCSSVEKFVVKGKMSKEGTFNAHFELTLLGDTEAMYRSLFIQTSRADWDKLAQTISQGMGYGGTVSNLDVSEPDDFSTPFRMSYDYERKEYGGWERKQLMAPLPPIGLVMLREDQRPKGDLYLGQMGVIEYHGEVELPKGYSLYPLEDFHQSLDELEYESKYVFNTKSEVLTTDRILRTKQNVLPIAKWARYKSMAKKANDEYSDMMNVQDGSAERTGTIKIVSSEGDTSARDLMIKAMEYLRNNDLSKSEELLQRAEKLNPDMRGLLSAWGYLYYNQHKLDKSFEYFKRHLDKYPDDYPIYGAFAEFQARDGRTEEALATLRQLLKVQPENLNAVLTVSKELLLKAKDASACEEVIKLLQPALKVNEENEELETLYGEALLKAGKSDEASKVFAAVLTHDPASSERSRIVLLLAEKVKDLTPIMDQYKKEVEAIEQKTAAITVEAPEDVQLHWMNDMALAWGTLGQLYFKAGDLDKSHSYLNAAWVLSQSTETATHLGILEEAQGHNIAAAHYFQLANDTTYTNSATEAKEHLKALAARGVTPPVYRSAGMGDELSAIKTVRMPLRGKVFRSAEFWILFEMGKAPVVQFLKGDESLRPLKAEIEKAKFNVPFPDNWPVKILRRGLLVCSPAAGYCEVNMLLPSMVDSVK